MVILFIRSCVTFSLVSSVLMYGLVNGDVETSVKKLVTANNDLAFKLYESFATESSENIFFSPFSVSTALAMLFAGAGGKTADELRTVLGYNAANLSNEEVSSAFSNYLLHVIPSNNLANANYTLELSNALLLQEGMGFHSSYEEEVQNNFMSYINEVDFATDTEKIKDEVNNFVKAKTHEKIDKILDYLDPSTVLLILNAIYFKGNWKAKFPEHDTKPQIFYNDGSSNEAKQVSFMHLKSKCRYTYDNNNKVQVLELPYEGDNIRMLILLPSERNGLANLENNLTQERFMSIQQQLSKKKVTISMPKFKIEYSKNLNSVFDTLGAKSMFTSLADFSKMSNSSNVKVSRIKHKAFVEVNEEGSEAAAATMVELIPVRAPYHPPKEITFIADHPFMFAIVDESNVCLFLGRVKKITGN